MLDVAIKRVDEQTVVDLGLRTAPPLPVLPALEKLLPNGLRRGSTVSVSGSLSLLLALLGAGSAAGAWCALVGLPSVSAEAADEYGIDLRRLAVVSPQSLTEGSLRPEHVTEGSLRPEHARGGGWATAVGALLDAMDVVVTYPPHRMTHTDVQRLAARARTRDAVLMPYLGSGTRDWPGADVRLTVRNVRWEGAGSGDGRLIRRRLEVDVAGRGQASRPRSAALWLPAKGGGAQPVEPTAPIIPIAPPGQRLTAQAS